MTGIQFIIRFSILCDLAEYSNTWPFVNRTFVNYLNSLVFKCQLYCKVVNRRFRNRLTINTRRNGEYRRVHVQEVDEDDIVPGLTSLIFTSGGALQWGLNSSSSNLSWYGAYVLVGLVSGVTEPVL